MFPAPYFGIGSLSESSSDESNPVDLWVIFACEAEVSFPLVRNDALACEIPSLTTMVATQRANAGGHFAVSQEAELPAAYLPPGCGCLRPHSQSFGKGPR